MKNKEIEVKFIINEKIKQNIIEDLYLKKDSITKVRQIDTYYISKFKEFEINGETVECVRIRETENKSVLTYKKIHREANPIFCDEYEVEILSKQSMENILIALDFEIQMVIDKTRESFNINNFEFDFDTVKNLGILLEIELKNESSTLDDVFELISKYGLTKNDVTYDGIQVLMKKSQSR